MSIDPEDFFDIDIDALDLFRPDLIMTELYNLKYPAFITLLLFEESPFVNKAEVLRMPDVPFSKFLTYSQDLIDPEELEKRNDLLFENGHLKDYTFKAKRWYKEGDTLLKKEVSFVVDFSLCIFWQQLARIGITKHEEDLGKLVD